LFLLEKRDILPGVGLTHIQTDKFKTGVMSLSLVRPLCREDASLNAILPQILRRGTRRLRDMEALSAELDDLYGAKLEPVVRKKGDLQCAGFVASVIDDAYVPEKLFGRLASLMGEVLLDPLTENGVFRSDYVSGEKTNLVDRIRAQINDKRVYARNRLTELMCADEPYGINALGDEQTASSIEAGALYRYYHSFLSESRVELFYCGSVAFNEVADTMAGALSALPRKGCAGIPEMKVVRGAGQVRNFTEAMDVSQGKLSIGFRTGVCAGEEGYPAMMLFNAVYGGTPNSKLFLNVREKLSLCYYASSATDFLKGIMAVYSGIEFDKFDAARNEILAQLEACREGKIEDWELEGARLMLKSSLLSTLDSQSSLEDYYLSQAITGLGIRPEELAARLDGVTPDNVVAAARAVQQDTVYFLKGREKEAAQ